MGVTAPASCPGGDAAEAMYVRKSSEHEAIRNELAGQNTSYRPIVWATHGRPHPQAMTALR
eukprot:5824660-Karenia_brevis.AAC.1